MNKFKEGDRVRSENTGYSYMIKMTEGIVVRTPSEWNNIYEVKVISGIFRNEFSKEFFTNADSRSFKESELEPLFKVGDEVEIIYNKDIKGNLWREAKIGLRGIITEISGGFYIIDNNKYYTNFTDNMLKLIKGGSTMCEKSLRDRIEALTGWNKEADDILQEISKNSKVDMEGYYLNIRAFNPPSSISSSPMQIMNPDNKVIHEIRYVPNQYSKLRAFKDALLYLLDKSGLEKVDKEKDELLKQIAELKSHHEQEGQKIKEMEDKVNGGNR